MCAGNRFVEEAAPYGEKEIIWSRYALKLCQLCHGLEIADGFDRIRVTKGVTQRGTLSPRRCSQYLPDCGRAKLHPGKPPSCPASPPGDTARQRRANTLKECALPKKLTAVVFGVLLVIVIRSSLRQDSGSF